MSRNIALVAAAWLISGCAANEDILNFDDDAVSSAPNEEPPGGVNPNGVNPNGVNPNGVNPNGVNPNGATLNGVNPNGVNPNGTSVGIAVTGPPLSGNLVGTQWTGQASTGANVALRIDAATTLPGSNSDIWAYQISVSADGIWRPLCLDGNGQPAYAHTVRGTWDLRRTVAGAGRYRPDASQFTIACRGSTIAKCVELGYKPWNNKSLELQTCVRALRADFCGDGTPYTIDGTLVNIFDAGGIQTDTINWVKEAEWTPDGARCVSHPKATRFAQVAHERPWCYPHALPTETSCGNTFNGPVLIITELDLR